MSPLRSAAIALVALAGLAVLPSSAAAQGAGPSHGVVIDGLYPTPDARNDAAERLRQLGARNAKIFIDWASLDEAPFGTARIAQFRETVDAFKAVGVSTTIIFFGSAQGSGPTFYAPPSDPAAWAARLGQVAAGMNGAGVTITIWNEADELPFWSTGPNPDIYVDLLKRGHAAIKANAPDATVAFTPLTGGNWRFLQAAYDRGAKGFFDAVPVDLGTACNLVSPTFYIRDPQDNARLSQTSFLAYREVRKTLLANGDAAIPLLNEFGWSNAQGATSCNQGLEAGKKPGGVSVAEQAQFLREAHHCMREDDYVQKAYWFEFKDRISDPKVGWNAFNPDDNFGLLTVAGAEKSPTFQAFQDVARGIDTIAGPCGDFVPPAIEVLRPQPGEKYADKIDIQVKANDAAGVARISLAFNGNNEIRNFTGADVGNDKVVGLTPWFKSSELALGNHTLSFIALDGFGNQQRVDVPIVKVTPAELGANFAATFALAKKVGCKKGNRRAKSAKARRPLCSFRGKLSAPAGAPSLGGRVLFQWQWYSPPKPKKKGVRKKAIPGQWKTLHKIRKPANKTFVLNQRMAKTGKWRLAIRHEATRPYKVVNAKNIPFTVR